MNPLRDIYRAFLKRTSAWRSTPVGAKAIAPARYLSDSIRRAVLALKNGAFDPSEAIFLTGMERSGTTWLAELLSASKDRCLVFQPIMEWWRKGIITDEEYEDYIDPRSEWPKGKKLFAELFQGRSILPHALTHSTLMSMIRSKSLVIKSVRANPILPWLAGNFKIKGMILITRHPCAVAVSLKMHGTKSAQGLSESNRRYVRQYLPHLTGYIQQLGTAEEFLTVRWCCEHHPPFKHAAEGLWIHVPYERLVLDGPAELEKIYSALDLPVSQEALRGLRIDSLVVGKWSVNHSRASTEQRLGAWKRRLDDEQIRRILSVVEAFGIRGYSDEPLPDFERIGLAK